MNYEIETMFSFYTSETFITCIVSDVISTYNVNCMNFLYGILFVIRVIRTNRAIRVISTKFIFTLVVRCKNFLFVLIVV